MRSPANEKVTCPLRRHVPVGGDSGLRKDILVLGFDGIPEGIALVKQLNAVGDVAQNAKGMGEKAVEVAVQVIKDKNAAATIPKTIDSGLTLVHPWNVDAYSKENFGK
jgi:ABC-type sugar transport system substrate-binding protein